MQRKVSTQKYVMAAFITGGIFLLGLFLGLVIEGKRVNFVEDSFEDQNVEFSSSQLQYSYVSSLDTKEACPAIYDIFYTNLENLEITRLKLVRYIKDSKLNDDAFNLLKRKYMIEQLNYWLLSQQAKELCSENLVSVLYFYSDDKECPRCGDQEFVLNYLKSVLEQNVLIFALDAQFEQEPMVGILKSRYDITGFPTLIIGDDALTGFQDKDMLMETVCDKFSDVPQACDDYAN